jgi:drug/metabolite transporter (DMT)-like permease
MNAAVKLLTAHYPVMQIVWARFTGHLVVMLLIFLPRDGRRLFATRRPDIQIGRSLLMLASNLVFVMAIGRVPLATASAIGFTAPLLVTALSVPLLGEHVGWRRWSAVLVGFARRALGHPAGQRLRQPRGAAAPGLRRLLRSLPDRDALDRGLRRAATGIVFSALLGSLAMSAVLPFVFVPPRNFVDFALFVSLGLVGGGGHYLLIRAFECAPPAVLAPLGYVELVGTTILGYLIFGNFPDRWTWIGAGTIILSGLYIAFRERYLRAIR